MNNYSKYFTVEELHFHLWNEVYNFINENWGKCKHQDMPVLAVLKHKIIQEFKNKGIVYEYKELPNDCFLCEEYDCCDCPLKRAYGCHCMSSYYYMLISFFTDYYLHGNKHDKKTVLLITSRIRDCYSKLNGDC